ncbi:MAG: lysophospholipid acyltransferase family protein [Proteobacteria bacterium]|nr:lysophospholipid acyltransferase family protein [Pseudomonadota bacterium]
MADKALVRSEKREALPDVPWWARGPLRENYRELTERAARLPTRLNEYGYDPFGYDPDYATPFMLPMVFLYRHWFRVETQGLERIPSGRVLLIGNHGGNTFAFDGAMLSTAVFLEGEPPRIARGMAEYYLPTIPFFGVAMHRMGSVVGTPANCVELLEHEEVVMVFPEGERGFVKPYSMAYQLQRFGLGFLRLALETDTPIVPVGIVGSEEQSPGLWRSRSLGRLIGAPVAPVTITMPWLGIFGFVPLPVKFRIHFGEPLRFDGDPNDEDKVIQKSVDVVKDAIRGLIEEGLAARKGWF